MRDFAVQKSVKTSGKRWLQLVLAVSLSAGSTIAVAKPHPYPQAFVAQAQSLFFDQGSLAPTKVDAYIARLKQKREEIRSLFVGDQALNGNRDPKKVAKKVDDEAALAALDVAIEDLEVMKKSKDEGVIYEKASRALEIEGALRIKGANWALIEVPTALVHSFQTWNINKTTTAAAEASDLYDASKRAYLSQEEIQNLLSKNADLSLYGPGPTNTVWVNQSNVSNIDVSKAAIGQTLDLYDGIVKFPADRVFHFDEVKHNDTKPKMNVYTVDEKGKKKDKFKLKFGAEVHSDPTSAALMLTLGFKADVTKYERDIKVYLGKTKLSDIKRDWETYYSRDYVRLVYPIEKFLKTTGTDEGGDFVIFREGLIEAKPKEIERLGGWQMADFSHTQTRAFRGLGFFQLFLANADMQELNNNRLLMKKKADGSTELHHMVSDVGLTFGTMFGEKPDLYPWDFFKSENSKRVELAYNAFPTSPLRNSSTVSDARWATRLIAKLTREQFTAAVDYGQWPQCMRPIIVEKLISRRNGIVKGFGLVGARQADGTVIQLIPQNINRADYTLKKRCDMEQVAEQYTSAFEMGLPQIANVIKIASRKFGLDFARKSINSLRRFQISGPQLGLSEHLVSDVIVDIDRTFERNPNPTSERDIYLLKDRVEIGFRLGAVYGVYKDFTYTKSYTLVYPARSIRDAELNNGFLVNLLLPLSIERGDVPEQYVLMTEHYIESGTGVQLENPDWLISPVLRVGGARVRLWRSIFDHRDPSHYVLYRDRSNFVQAKLEAMLRLFIFKLPVFTELHKWGVTTGRGSIFTAEELSKSEHSEALFSAIRDGDFKSISERERKFELTNAFDVKERRWNFLFWSGTRYKELDQIVMTEKDMSQSRIQFRTMSDSSKNFLGNKEQKSVSVEAFADAAKPGQYQLNVRVMSWDSVTQEKHMENRYLSFINGLSIDGKKVINLTPSLGYTTNKLWGATVTTSDTLYTEKAMEKILSLTPASFFSALAATIGVTPEKIADMKKQLRRYRAEQTPRGTRANIESFGMTADDAEMLVEADRFMKRLDSARKEKKPDSRIKGIAEAVRNAIFVGSSGFYSPRLLGALNRVAGVDNLYSRNMITSPPFVELNLLQEIAMFGEVGKPIESDMSYIAFKPVTALDLYTMFDGWF